jgi:hypothetical protein
MITTHHERKHMKTRTTFKSATVSPWTCERCNGDQMCKKCEREMRLRTIAVRLLGCPGSPHYDARMSGEEKYSGTSRATILSLVEALAARLRSGEVPIPEVLPVRVRHDDERRVKLAHGIYRALGDGSRRRVRSEFGA